MIEGFLIALAGGALIGLAATVYFAGLGRIAGISGIIGGALSADDRSIRWGFLLGLVVGAGVFFHVLGLPPSITIDAKWPILIIAGVLVGFGTRLGAGCTSGHGVCGLARLSPRSIAATLIFFSVALVTVYLVRHVFIA